MSKTIISILLIMSFGCTPDTTSNDFLVKAFKNLEQVKSVSYFSIKSASAPGDTLKFTEVRRYRKILINPVDSLVGSISMEFSVDDTSKVKAFYDGKVQGTINWDKQYVLIDSFKNNRAPFRLVHYPLYAKVKEIIKYTLTTEDSIRTEFKNYGDSILFSLKIINKHVYFHIKPIEISNEYIPKNEISQFDIWFNTSDNMPYRMRSKWSHTTHFESCENANFNANEIFDFKNIYPGYFEVNQFKRDQRIEKNNLIGKKAPDWILRNTDQKIVKLNDLDSKVLLIQFTGVGCGPCHQSIPFLKRLVASHKSLDFDFISIETWSNNIEGLKRYEQKNELPWKFLRSDDEVAKAYEIKSVPAFFILDENKIIRNVINGYDKKITDSEIIQAIDLIN
jgi:peroxiredoxin